MSDSNSNAAAAASAAASYKRKRSSKACTVCRQKKVRCSGNEPCRHCIEFGETLKEHVGIQCIFDDSHIQSTKTLSELQLRVVRLEAYIMHFAGSDLSPLSNFRGGGGVEFDDQVIYIPGNGAPPEPASAASESRDTTSWTSIPSLNGSRKRRRQDESPDPDEVLRNESGPSSSARIGRNGQNKDGHSTVEQQTQSSPPPVASTFRLPAGSTSQQRQSSPHGPTHHQRRSSDQERVQPIQPAQQAHTRTKSQEDRSHAYMDEAQHLDTMTEHNDSYEVSNAVFNEKLVYHPFTSRIAATARDIPPEEMFSTDEEDPSATREEEGEEEEGLQQAVSAASRNRVQRSSLSMSTPASSANRDLRTLDNNAPRSPPLSSQRGFTNESSTGAATSTSTSMKRTGSASSAPAALGPTTAKISSSTNSELRVDKKGNLRYLGSASTSAVVAELADRQRWDVESPGLQEAAAARRRDSARTTPGTPINSSGTAEGGTASSVTGSLATVNEVIDLTQEDKITGKQQAEQAAQQHFARPLLRPKPWEIFSNLGVTVAGALPPVEEVALPHEDLAKSLIDGFFEHLHPLFPVLHKTALMKDVKTVYYLRAKGEMRKADPPFLTLLFAVFACGALVSDDPRVYEEGGYSDNAKTYPVEQGPLDPFSQWRNDVLENQNQPQPRTSTGSGGASGSNSSSESASAAGGRRRPARTKTFNFGLSDQARRQGVRRAGHRYYAQVNILILHSLFQPSVDQAVLYGLMAFFHVSSNAAARAWLLSGQALRLAIELGLHRSSANFKPYVRERRRRVFWALFSLESLLANNLGRPSSIPLYEIDQERPENLNLDDLMALTLQGPPRVGEIAGFLHLVKLHWITAEALRTIARHQRQFKPISAAELQKRLLKYEGDLRQWYCSMPFEYAGLTADVPADKVPERFIMNLSFPCALLLLFMPFMPRKGEEATEFQTYALARCLYSCKDHIDFAAIYQHPIPPSHYLFNITQHLLVAGALLLLICHRGLQDPKLLDCTVRDVDNSIIVLQHIGERFVGGTAGAEMLQNMKDNMKHSDTWKTRQQKIEEMEAAQLAQKQTTPVPSWPLPGPKRIPGLLQPSTGNDAPTTSRTSPSHSALRSLQEQQNTSPPQARNPVRATQTHPAGPPILPAQTGPQSDTALIGNTAPPPAPPLPSVPPTGAMLGYNAYEPGYLYPSQPSAPQFGVVDNHLQQMPVGAYPPNPVSATSFLDDYYQAGSSLYGGAPAHGSSSSMPSYNTPDQQPLWPSDTLNFNIKDLEEITARSYNSSFMNNNSGFSSDGSQFPYFQF